jgi:predicted nuclease of restriction endonuclease-like (RecB) superfamily
MAKSKTTQGTPAPQGEVDLFSNKEYNSTLADLKKQIRECQLKAVTAANKELILLYWTVGKAIVERQEGSGWGTKFIEKLAKDLQNEFPGVEGFSRRNVFRMRSFYAEYKLVPQAVAQLDGLPIFCIPWGHNILILEKVKHAAERLWYAAKAMTHGWSRSMLEMWIKSDLYNREGKAITNFQQALPPPQSDLAQQALQDPYTFDFLTLHQDHLEKDLEDGLVNHIQKFLLELGQGFAFVGRQYPIKAGEKDLYVDLLFYHLQLRCYVVVELKAREFDSRDAGQMSAYLSAVDDLLRHEEDKPTIGMILCKTKDDVFVEYVLRNFNRPIGVAQFEAGSFEKLPKELKSSLPTIKEIEEELGKEAAKTQSK